MTDLHGLWIPGNAPIPMRLNTRVRWVADEDYEGLDGFMEHEELDKLERGDLIAVGCIMETRCVHCEVITKPCRCPNV